MQRFAKAHRLPLKQAQRVLERDLAYTLHKPRRRRFPMVPVVVGGLDDQWVADLVEVHRWPNIIGPTLLVDGRGCLVEIRVGATLERQNRRGPRESL